MSALRLAVSGAVVWGQNSGGGPLGASPNTTDDTPQVSSVNSYLHDGSLITISLSVFLRHLCPSVVLLAYTHCTYHGMVRPLFVG